MAPSLAWHLNMALAYSGVTSKASSMPPIRLLRAHRHALEFITSLRAAGVDQVGAPDPDVAFGGPGGTRLLFLTVIPLVAGAGACVDVRAGTSPQQPHQREPQIHHQLGTYVLCCG